MPEIEFVDPDPEPGVDEELTTGPRREWSARTKRAVRLGAGAALAVVAAVVVVGAVRQGGGGVPSGGSSTPAGDRQLAPDVPSGAFRVDHLGPEAPEGARPGTLAGRTPSAPAESTTTVEIDCPVVDACDVQLTLPPAVSAALSAHLTGVTRVAGASVLVRGPHPTLRSRQVTAHAGRLDVRLLIQPAGAGAHSRSHSSSVGSGATGSATAVAHGLAVTVTVSGPDTQVPGLPTLRALAADRRLLTVG